MTKIKVFCSKKFPVKQTLTIGWVGPAQLGVILTILQVIKIRILVSSRILTFDLTICPVECCNTVLYPLAVTDKKLIFYTGILPPPAGLLSSSHNAKS